MFLAKPGEYSPCGLYNIKHFSLFIITIIGITIAVKFTKTKNKNNIRKIIRILTCVMWILEILKICFNIKIGNVRNMNKILPLYYCSLLLYAGILSSIGKGTIKRIGDVFLATGAFVGGIVFLIFPTTSLPEYPMFHFMSLHSFIFHGIMVYISIIVNKLHYINLQILDVKYYACLVFIVCICASIINSIFGSNLMFISQDFPGTPISYIYKATGKFFTLFMSIVQMTLPFFVVYGFLKIIQKCKFKNYKYITNENN